MKCKIKGFYLRMICLGRRAEEEGLETEINYRNGPC